MTDQALPLVYKVAEVAKLLHVGEPRVYQMVASGAIPAIKLSEKAIVVPREALERFLVEEAFRQQAQRQVPAAADVNEMLARLPVTYTRNGSGRRVRVTRMRDARPGDLVLD